MNQPILLYRSGSVYANETAAWAALDAVTHKKGQPIVAFYTLSNPVSGHHGSSTIGAIFAIGIGDGVGKYKACTSHDDMLIVAQSLNAHITQFNQMFEYDANHNAIKAKLDFYTTDGKSISAGGIGSGSSASLGALYQLVDVMANSSNTGVEGAVEGSVLAYDAKAGKWKAIAQSEILPDMSGYYTKDETDAAINDAKSNLQGQVDTLQAFIPATATATNQLADKDFVNSSIATATAEFKGSFTSLDELKATSGNLNDYAFYLHTDDVGNKVVDRYKWTTAGWLYEYTLNNSSFTAEQWAALNSAITATLVQSYNSHLKNTTIHITSAERTAWNNKWDYNEETIKGVKVNAAVLSDSATKLATARKIWGRYFDGLADVSGDLIDVGNITASGKATIEGDIVCGGEVVAVAGEGTPAGVTDYSALTGKPAINGVTLVSGNNTLASLGIQAAGDYATNSGVTTLLANYADKTFVSNNYVGKTAFNNHTADTDIHITAAERTAWNNKWDYNEETIKGVKVNAAVNADNADTVDGLHSRNIYKITDYTAELIDVDTTETNRVIHSYQWTNTPISDIASLIDYSYSIDWRWQLFASPSYQKLYSRYRYNGRTWTDWREFAFTDSDITGNAASATKLKTPRTLWGKHFDGSANVDGDLINVGNITASGKATIQGDIVCGGEVAVIAGEGTPAGVTDYSALTGKPQINGVTLVSGNNTLASLGIQAAGDYATNSGVTTLLADYATKTFVSNNYVGKTAFNNHTADTDIHITSAERAAWNAKWDYNENTIKAVKVTSASSADSVAWTGISGKPSTFTPSAHTHTASEVSGLPTSLKNPYALTFGSKTYDGSAAATITASDLGALTSITKSMVEGVLTGDITSHTHSFASLTSKPTTIAGYGITDALTTSNYNSYAPTLTGTGASGTWGISISGNAATATNADTVDGKHNGELTAQYFSAGTMLTHNDTINTMLSGVYSYINADNPTGSIGDNCILVAFRTRDRTDNLQIVSAANERTLYYRIAGNIGNQYENWTAWRELIHSDNYNKYAPSLTGTGASGTWGINISGNAASATKLQTPRTIWGQSFDGTSDVNGDAHITGDLIVDGEVSALVA